MSDELIPRRTTDPALPDKLPQTEAIVAAPPTRIGFLIFLLILLCSGLWGGLGIWAATAPLQSAVIAVGSFKVDGNLPAVQHLEGGLVRKLRVADGDHVHKGQVLLELETVVSTAQDRILMNELVNSLAVDARLEAEMRDHEAMTYSPELQLLVDNYAPFAELAETQRDLFVTNTEMWKGQAAILQERWNELQQQLQGQIARRDALQQRLEIVQTDLHDLKGLLDKGLVTKTRYTARRENEVALLGDLSVVDSQIEAVHQRISETSERILQVRRERAMRISAERQAIKQGIFDIRQRLIANDDVRERALVRAPVAGRVIGLKVNSPGEVIGEGQRLMQIVPSDAVIIAEGRVRPADVDQVTEGMQARVRLTAYNFRTTPPVDGTVRYVSADALSDEETGQEYYLAKIELSDEALASLPEVDVQAGMPAQIMIATGGQTVADYILGPVLSSVETAMRESD